MPAKVHYMGGSCGAVIEGLTQQFNKGEIKSIVVMTEDNEGNLQSGWNSGSSMIELLGMAEMVKQDLYNYFNEED